MNHVYYDVKVDAVPSHLQPSSRIDDLLAFKVASQQFNKEKDLVDRYAKLSRESTFNKIDHTSHLEIFKKETIPEVGIIDSNIPTITPITQEIIKPQYNNDTLENEAYISPPVLTQTSSYNAVDEFSTRQDKLDKMAQATGQTVDVCHFYLEMVEWDFENAVQMFTSSS